MSNKETGTKTKKISASIVYKLNTKLLFRMLILFLVLNFFVFCALGIQTVIKTERELTSVVLPSEAQILPGLMILNGLSYPVSILP